MIAVAALLPIDIDASRPQAIGEYARRLNQECRFDEVDAILCDAIARMPRNAEVFASYVRAALERGDWEGAIERAASLRQAFPDVPIGYQAGLRGLYELYRLDEAAPVLDMAAAAFPDANWPLAERARFAEAGGDWDRAESIWSTVCERFPDLPIGWAEKAAHYAAIGRLDAAEIVVLDGLQRFPDHAPLYVVFGRLARSSVNPDEADWRWSLAAQRFPHNPGFYLEYAEVPLLGKNRDTAAGLARFEELHRRFPQFSQGYRRHIWHLRNSGRIEAAEALASAAINELRPQGAHAGVAVDLASIREGNSAEAALELLRELTDTLPYEREPYVALAALLSRLRRLAEAEQVCEIAIARFRFAPGPLAEYANIAMRRDDWRAALRRWEHAAQLMPRNQAIGPGLETVRLILAQRGEFEAEGEIAPAKRGGSLRSIMMGFESLGGPGVSCELGLVQRRLGAEPIGLLRWANITTENLIAALDDEFSAVGTPEQTEIVLSDTGEYMARDRRFGIQMHTFVRRSERSVESLHKEWCGRLAYLRRKMLRDLMQAKKVFAYRIQPEDVENGAIHRLSAAIRRYGDGALLCVRIAAAGRPVGFVEQVTPFLMLGYLDRLLDDGLGIPDVSGWARVCTEVCRLLERPSFESSASTNSPEPA